MKQICVVPFHHVLSKEQIVTTLAKTNSKQWAEASTYTNSPKSNDWVLICLYNDLILAQRDLKVESSWLQEVFICICETFCKLNIKQQYLCNFSSIDFK